MEKSHETSALLRKRTFMRPLKMFSPDRKTVRYHLIESNSRVRTQDFRVAWDRTRVAEELRKLRAVRNKGIWS